MTVSADFKKQLKGYGLTTAKIWYFNPDNPHVINGNWLLWQEYDICPEFPELREYLSKWGTTIETKIACVFVAHSRLIKPAEIRSVDGVFRLH